MTLVKVWLGAVVVLVVFLGLTALLDHQAEVIEHCATQRCT